MRFLFMTMALLATTALSAQYQPDYLPAAERSRTLLSLSAGFIRSLDMDGSFPVYGASFMQYQNSRYFSLYAALDYWKDDYDSLITRTIAVTLHPAPREKLDTFIGIGILSAKYENGYIIDLPAIAGMHIWLSDSAGIKFEGRFYLIEAAFYQLSAGFFIGL
jgi:hypothetical protein